MFLLFGCPARGVRPFAAARMEKAKQRETNVERSEPIRQYEVVQAKRGNSPSIPLRPPYSPPGQLFPILVNQFRIFLLSLQGWNWRTNFEN